VQQETPSLPVGQHPQSLFRPISEYPYDVFRNDYVYCGPEVLVRVPPSSIFPYGFTYFAAQLDGRDWIARQSFDLGHSALLHGKPDAWMPIPGIFLTPAGAKPNAITPSPASTLQAWPRVVPAPQPRSRVQATFLPMVDYPLDYLHREEVYWGPTVLLRVPPRADLNAPTFFVCHLEADDWITRAPDDPGAWCYLWGEPDAWMPIPGVSLKP